MPNSVPASVENRNYHFYIALLFIFIAVLVRIIFWIYTQRIWEDALISLTPARNVWEGFGLTHHASEPRVHSFTSALGELILISGESIRQGIATMRIASLASAAIAIYFCYKIAELWRFTTPAICLVLAFLALDHLQIFFGMAGMETQVATAVFFACIYYFLKSEWTMLGISSGLALICRPEFTFLLLPIGISLLTVHRSHLLRSTIAGALVAGPWLLFATLYYGSPVPHTIYAKSALNSDSFLSGDAWQYLLNTWRSLAPFREYWAVSATPVPEWLLVATVLSVVVLALVGFFFVFSFDKRAIVPASALFIFFSYRTLFNIDPYYMWYMPPFMGLLFLFAGGGLSYLQRNTSNSAAVALSAYLILAYSVHLPFTMPIDRAVQQEIEDGIRTTVGIKLNELMTEDDNAVLEPLGYIGWQARNKTIFDFPGLSSPTSRRILEENTGQGIPGVIRELKPDYLVLRPRELASLRRWLPRLASSYQVVYHIKPEKKIKLSRWGVSYSPSGTEFYILSYEGDSAPTSSASG